MYETAAHRHARRVQRGLVALAAVLALAGSAAAQAPPPRPPPVEGFRCAGELSTGFQADGQRWTQANFATDEDVFLVRQVPGEDRFTVRRAAADKELYYCRKTKGPDPSASKIICSGAAQTMIIDTLSLRFEEVLTGAFLKGDAEGSVLSLTIGSCSRMP